MENKIPLLKASDIECRVQSVSENKAGRVGAILLVYKDARVDMRILDQVYGSENWQRSHEVIGDNLYCNIDIWDKEKKTWIRKQDVGVESHTEKEKGQASDAFKRAGFNIGIGRELYTAPFIYVELQQGEHYKANGKIRCSPRAKFHVAHIAYNDNREIVELVIEDTKGNIRYKMGGGQTQAKTPQAKAKPKPKQNKSKEDKKITKSQAQRLFAIAGKDKEAVRILLKQKGHEHSTDIKASEYEEFCKEVEELAERRKEIEGEQESLDNKKEPWDE